MGNNSDKRKKKRTIKSIIDQIGFTKNRRSTFTTGTKPWKSLTQKIEKLEKELKEAKHYN